MDIQIQVPVSGASSGCAIIQGFGGRPEVYARFGLRGHNGLDFACPVGTPVFAAASGTVTKIQTDPDGYGLHVRLTHPWGRTIYAHLSEVTCRLGQIAPAGALIARSGDSGFSDCPHLHFEVRRNGLEANGFNGAVDPLPLLSAPPAEPRPETPPLSGAEAPPPETPYPELVEGSGVEGSVETPGAEPRPLSVIVPYINLRTGPAITFPIVGMLYPFPSLPYDRLISQGSDLWMQFGPLFAAARYGGDDYVSGLPPSLGVGK